MERTKVEDLEKDHGRVEYGDDEKDADEDKEECGKQWEKDLKEEKNKCYTKKKEYRNVKIKENFKN